MKRLDKKLLKKLTELRRYFHKFPELSGEEANTAVHVEKYLNKLRVPEVVTEVGGFGVIAKFRGKNRGKRVMLRCDMDALPIQESNEFLHRSKMTKISHACGHDGHMTIMLGVAELLSRHPPENGEVVLLFQPAEETGEGAKRVLEDPKFREFFPDMVFALHNLPGHPPNSIIVKDGCFASGSAGMESIFIGKTSHAGEPEKGKNPSLAVAQIVRDLYYLNQSYESGTFITVVQMDVGERSYGTLPGRGELRCAIRSAENESMMKIAADAENIITHVSVAHQLASKIRVVEEFPPLMNDPEMTERVVESAKDSALELIGLGKPLPWSEDFSRFLQQIPGCMFGLGAGKGQAKLHQSDYDFPNRLIEGGVKIFYNLINRINGIAR